MADLGRDFDDILDECLERLAAGDTVSECCARYPEHADELAPLLLSASAVRQTARATPHLAVARARGHERFAQALAQRGAAPAPSPSLWERLNSMLRTPVARPVLAAFAAVVVVLFVAGGTSAAARSRVPGEPLYWVTTTQENLSLRMQRDDMGRSEQHARMANERSSEMHTLIERGNLHEAEALVVRFRRHINQSAQYAGIAIVVNPVEMPNRVIVHLVPAPQLTPLRALFDSSEKHRLYRRDMALQSAPSTERLRAQIMIGQCDFWYKVFQSALHGQDEEGRLIFRAVAGSSFGP